MIFDRLEKTMIIKVLKSKFFYYFWFTKKLDVRFGSIVVRIMSRYCAVESTNCFSTEHILLMIFDVTNVLEISNFDLHLLED